MSSGDRPTTRVALVNNMADAAFDSTERQFLDLVRGASTRCDVDVALYSLPGIERGPAVAASLRDRYFELPELARNPPDALIVTGTEPREATLQSEQYWDALVDVIAWAEHATVSTVLSCLAAHAALSVFEAIERQPLPIKSSGIFESTVVSAHPLVAGLGESVPVPHSRLNEVPTALLDERGYTTLLRAGDAGWSVAVKQRSGCLFVLCQGHLEYGTESLLREYRRDVRRFLAGERSAYPDVPVNYVDAQDEVRLEEFRSAVLDGSDVHGEHAFPYDEVAAALVNRWQEPAERFYANWLALVAEQAQLTRERVLS